MSKYQVTNYGICGECKYHERAKWSADWICTNPNGEYYALSTDYTDTCEEWEQRGIE